MTDAAPLTAEFRLLLLAARTAADEQNDGAIRQILEQGVDWTLFAQQATAHEVAGLAGQTLLRAAPDLVPDDILDAFRMLIGRTRHQNRLLFDSVAEACEALAHGGIEALATDGPVLVLEAYGDLGLRAAGNTHLLVRDEDAAVARAALPAGTEIEITPFGDTELWRRTRRTNGQGRSILTPAPEDTLLLLAASAGHEPRPRLAWACDVAAFAGSHPTLDWSAVHERAKAQGRLRVLRLATALACRCFDAPVRAEGDNPAAGAMADIAIAQWQGGAPPSSDPRDAAGWTRRANTLFTAKRFAEASEASDRALELDPRHVLGMRIGVVSRVRSCDWRRRDDDIRWAAAQCQAAPPVMGPFFHRGIRDSEAESLVLAQRWGETYPRPAEPLWRGERYRHSRIRIAYVSADLDDPMTHLTAGVFEHHDKARFEIVGLSLGPAKASAWRRRIKAAFDRFIEGGTMTDADAAKALRGLETDIAVDLSGHTGRRTLPVLASRPAPVQVNLPGYPGTLGVPFIDYIIADRVVIPEENRIHYSEQVVYLPHSYQANDRNRRTSKKTPSRVEAGLPDSGFVFACFNNNYKIGPGMFDVWMRLLTAVEGSVLWLLEDNVSASVNLRREARTRGVDPDRLVFAPWTQRDPVARARLADLFLDTLPFNAHATASDVLRAGLPIVTCVGRTFAARVAASLLQAIGLPEMVTASLEEYEALALALARDPDRLRAIKARLLRNRETEPLFDTARFTRHLEAAYAAMWERQEAGLPPAPFAVPATP